MLHSENQVETESHEVLRHRKRIGLLLLSVFSATYFGFIALCAFANNWFSSIRYIGVPATVWYGFALIALALIIAGVYGRLSRVNSRSN